MIYKFMKNYYKKFKIQKIKPSHSFNLELEDKIMQLQFRLMLEITIKILIIELLVQHRRKQTPKSNFSCGINYFVISQNKHSENFPKVQELTFY